MADIAKVTLLDGNTYDIKDAIATHGLFFASYGHTTYAECLAAYKAKEVVYCKASSNSNPATGSQNRLAFLAYVNNGDTPTEFEFQYYRSIASHSNAQQGDQVYVYKLKSTSAWEVTIREAYTKVVAGTGLESTYSSGAITLKHKASGVTAASKGDTANQTPGFGDTFKAVSGTVDAQGHLTDFAEHTVTIPNATATDSAAGLMSASDKSALDTLGTNVGNHTVASNVPANAVFTDTTYENATTSAAGLMSASDKSALDTLGTNIGNHTVASDVPANAVFTDTTYSGSSPISVSGTTISHADSGVTAASKGDTTNQTPAFGGTFKALSGTVNASGHLTAFAEHTVTIPNATATVNSAGLMSAADKGALNNLDTRLSDVESTLANIDLSDPNAALYALGLRVAALESHALLDDGYTIPSQL